MAYQMGGKERRAHPSWFRGEHTNFHPRRASLKEKGAIDTYVVSGWAPSSPFIAKTDYITPFGSCFAQNVAKYLVREGYGVFGGDIRPDEAYVIRCGEGMVNAAVIAQQFQWAYGEVDFDETLWHDKSGNVVEYLAEVRESTRAIFDKTNVFILTFGLSEVWYSKQTGDVFWRSVPREMYDPEKHGFKVLSVAETTSYLKTIMRLIRTHRPDARVIFTLSPIPLTATFRPVTCITANSVSKAVLRVAIDEYLRGNDDDRLHYFPSYEIATQFFRDAYEDDLRHIRPDVIEEIMQTFARHYLKAG